MNTRLVLTVLVVANVVSALAVVYARHQHRQLFVQGPGWRKRAMNSISNSDGCSWSRRPGPRATASTRSPATGSA